MGYEQRDMSGSTFLNDKREGESHPHFKGTAMIDGIEYWHSIWKKKTKNGATWLSSSFTRKEARPERPKEPRPQAEPAWGSDVRKAPVADFDDVPF